MKTLLGLGGLLEGLLASELGGLLSLGGLLGLLDGAGAGDSLLLEVSAVVALDGRVDDVLVDPSAKSQQSCLPASHTFRINPYVNHGYTLGRQGTYLREEVEGP